MQAGISTYTYGWNIMQHTDPAITSMNEKDLVQQAIRFGLKCIQMGDNLPMHLWNASRKTTFAQMLETNSIRLEIGAKNLNETHLNDYIQLSGFFKAPLLRFVIDDIDYQPALQEIISIIKNQLAQLKANHVLLGIENHDRFKAKYLAAIIARIGDDQVGICLDSANSIGAGEQIETVVDCLGPHTINLHIKDITIKRQWHKMGFLVEGVPAGQGMIPIPWLIEQIAERGRCESAILEQWVPPDDDLKQTCEKEKKWADLGLQYLKTIL